MRLPIEPATSEFLLNIAMGDFIRILLIVDLFSHKEASLWLALIDFFVILTGTKINGDLLSLSECSISYHSSIPRVRNKLLYPCSSKIS